MINKKDALKSGIKIIDSKEEPTPLLEHLKAHFPQTVKDKQVDLKAIAMLLGLNTKADIQGYELTFTGKALANALYSAPTQKVLKYEESFPKDSQQIPQNFIIKGDNLDALKALKAAYYEKIKMIYIDPPYNTKNEDFIYPDNFRKDYKTILQEVGLLEIDDEGNECESETLQFFKNIQSTRTHSGWLAFMLPRLKLARDLLKEDGVIFISIDDNEQANLKILCDEIFGEENFIDNIFVLDNLKGKANDNFISSVGHKILIYVKNITALNDSGGFNEIENIFGDKIDNKFKNEDSLGFYTLNTFCKTGQGRLRENRPLMYYPILLKNGKLKLIAENEYEKIYNKTTKEFDDNLIMALKEKYEKMNFKFLLPLSQKNENLRWTSSFNTAKYLIEIGDLIWDNGVKQKKRPSSKEMLQIYASGVPKSFFYKPQYANGTDELINIFNKDIFSFPKSTFLIKDLLKISTIPTLEGGGGEDIVLDFFAGSGTTAQAVMELNAEDGGNRKFILVQLEEPIDAKKSKTAYDFCKNTLKSREPVISDITIERVKRAAAKLEEEKQISNAFSILSLEDRPELIADKKGTLKLKSHAQNPRDKALNLALQSGKMLHQPLKCVFEDRLYQCEECYYLIACDDEVLNFLRTTQNEKIYIDGYEDFSLEDFLNLDFSLNDRLRVVY